MELLSLRVGSLRSVKPSLGALTITLQAQNSSGHREVQATARDHEFRTAAASKEVAARPAWRAFVVRTAEGSPAASAGLRGINAPAQGGTIEADGKPVHRLGDLTDQLEQTGVGKTVQLNLRRGQKYKLGRRRRDRCQSRVLIEGNSSRGTPHRGVTFMEDHLKAAAVGGRLRQFSFFCRQFEPLGTN